MPDPPLQPPPLMQGGPLGQQACPLAPHAHSQPFARLPSQLAKKFSQVVYVQAPALHATPLAWRLLQLFVHEPQCARSVRRFVSQPVLLVPQCAKPAAQVDMQAPAVHAAVPFVGLQTVPQTPQLRASAFVSRQSLLQQSLPAAQGFVSQLSTHVPLGLHVLPPVHGYVGSAHSTH